MPSPESVQGIRERRGDSATCTPMRTPAVALMMRDQGAERIRFVLPMRFNSMMRRCDQLFS
jgi:hypothetical protein